MKKHRSLAILTCLAMALSMAACGPTTSGTDASKAPDTPASAAPSSGGDATGAPADPGTDDPYAEKLDLSWMCFNQYEIPYEGSSSVEEMIEERFNVNITVPLVDTMNEEKMAAFFASGESPDLINGNVMSKFYHQIADQGVVRPFPHEWLQTYAPDWMKNLYDMGLTDADIDNQIVYKDECWMMPLVNCTFKQTFIAGVRSADLAKAGMTEPPKTLDEYHALMVALSDKANSVYANHGNVNGNWNFVFAAYDFIDNAFRPTDDGNSVYFTRATDRWKEILTLLSTWYGEGLIDPEFITDTRDIQRAKWTEGKLRVMIDHPWWWDTATSGSVYKLLDEKGEEQTFFGAVQGPYGNKSFVLTPNMNNNGMYFGADTSDAKVQRIMAIKNELAKDVELWKRCYYGVEGESWEAKPAGNIGFTADMTPDKNMQYGILQHFALAPMTFDRLKLSIDPADMRFYDLSEAQTEIVPALATSGTNKTYDERWADLDAVGKAYMNDVVTGRVNIDATWDQYLKDLEANGLSAIIKGYEEVLIK